MLFKCCITLQWRIFCLFIILILHFSRLVIRELTSNFFSSPFSEQVELFILPSIAAHNEFPFNVWLQVQTSPLLWHLWFNLNKTSLKVSFLTETFSFSKLTELIWNFTNKNTEFSITLHFCELCIEIDISQLVKTVCQLSLNFFWQPN